MDPVLAILLGKTEKDILLGHLLFRLALLVDRRPPQTKGTLNRVDSRDISDLGPYMSMIPRAVLILRSRIFHQFQCHLFLQKLRPKQICLQCFAECMPRKVLNAILK